MTSRIFLSRIILARTSLALMIMAGISAVAPAMADDEVVVASRAKLPTEAEVAKAKADAEAKAATTAKPVNTPEQNVAWLASAQQGQSADRTAKDNAASSGDLTGLKQIHGTAGVSIGTGGYRSAYVTSVIPVGETGLLGIAVSQTDYGKNNRFGYGYDDYGYDGYGYGRRGYGYGYGQRGGTSQSFGLSLNLNARNRNDDTPAGCAPGFRDGGHYVEPVWVTQMNGGRNCAASAEEP